MREMRLSIPTFDITGASVLFEVSCQAVALPYDNYTETLPLQPHFESSEHASLRPFQEIMLQPSSQAARHTDEVLQRRFEIDKGRRQQATICTTLMVTHTMLSF
jgi:hypothetical protein